MCGDGEEIGPTPLRHPMKAGTYDVAMQIGESRSSTNEVLVGNGVANRHTWQENGDEWQAGYF